MNGFERRKEQSKERIRQAALDLFKVYGFEQVTITHIARHADVSQVTIYNHFGSKDELVHEIIRILLDGIIEKHRAIIYGEGTFVEKLETMIFDKIEMLSHYKGELLRTMFQCDPKIQQIAGTLLREELGRLTIDLFNQGKKEGYIKPELTDEAIMAWDEILRRGIIASSKLGGLEQNVKQNVMRELKGLFLGGLVEKQNTYSDKSLVASQV